MPKAISVFTLGTVESVAHALGELYSGSELTRLLADVRLPDPLGEGATKWKRLAAAMGQKQAQQGDGRPVVALINAAMSPDRTLSRRDKASVACDELNQVLSLSGYRVRDDGKVCTATRATTDTEAAQRSTRLRTGLIHRGAHSEVLRYCRPELLTTDFYEAVFESIKGLGDRLRAMSGLDADGWNLIESALEGATPPVQLNDLSTRTLRNAQRGIAQLAKGAFSAFRNPAGHEPRLKWSMTEQDALDVMSTLSMIHRRLDTATLHPE